jgi:nucleoside-diphosphate-sugar epimerase
MKVLIIGGTGFVGPHVAERLRALGCGVTVFHRGRTEADLDPAIRHLHCPAGTMGDRAYFADFVRDFTDCAPDVVLDMIPVTEEDARTVIRTFRGIARRVVALSSQDVYRAYGVLSGTESPGLESPRPESPGLEPVPIPETGTLRTKLFPYRLPEARADDDPRRWMDDYEKILVERAYLSEPDLPGTVLRLPMVYGPRDRQHRMHEYLRRMADGRTAILLEENLARWRWTRGYTENVAVAIVLAVIHAEAAGRIYNVGEPDALTMTEWVQEIARAAGWQGEVVTASGDQLPEDLRPPMDTRQDLVTDSSSIRQELGYEEVVSRDEAILRTVEWERGHPPEPVRDLSEEYAREDAVLESLRNQGGQE